MVRRDHLGARRVAARGAARWAGRGCRSRSLRWRQSWPSPWSSELPAKCRSARGRTAIRPQWPTAAQLARRGGGLGGPTTRVPGARRCSRWPGSVALLPPVPRLRPSRRGPSTQQFLTAGWTRTGRHMPYETGPVDCRCRCWARIARRQVERRTATPDNCRCGGESEGNVGVYAMMARPRTFRCDPSSAQPDHRVRGRSAPDGSGTVRWPRRACAPSLVHGGLSTYGNSGRQLNRPVKRKGELYAEPPVRDSRPPLPVAEPPYARGHAHLRHALCRHGGRSSRGCTAACISDPSIRRPSALPGRRSGGPRLRRACATRPRSSPRPRRAWRMPRSDHVACRAQPGA